MVMDVEFFAACLKLSGLVFYSILSNISLVLCPFFLFPHPIPSIGFCFFLQKVFAALQNFKLVPPKKKVIFSITKNWFFVLLPNYFPLAISWELYSNAWPAQRQADMYLQDITIHCWANISFSLTSPHLKIIINKN